MRDHALREQACERFAGGQVELTDIAKGARKKARVEQVEHGMLDTADILVDRQPVGALFRVCRARKARIIPGRIDESVERIGLANGGFAALRAVHMLPVWMVSQRIAGLVEADIFRKFHWKVSVRNRDRAAVFAMNDRDRAAPVALARHAPVSKAVIDRTLAEAKRFDPGDGCTNCLVRLHPIEEIGIIDRAGADIGRIGDFMVFRARVGRQHDRLDRQVIFTGKVEVALVAGGRAEDSAGAIGRQDEIG